MPIQPDNPFHWRHYEPEVILTCVRWYLDLPLSYRNVVVILHSEVTVGGFANHAGTTPMNQRHDALLSAARLIEKVNDVVASTPGGQVGTVGWVKAQPGAYNVIAGEVTLGLELRDLDERKIHELFDRIRSEAESIGRMNGTRLSFTEPMMTHAALTDKSFQKILARQKKSWVDSGSGSLPSE